MSDRNRIKYYCWMVLWCTIYSTIFNKVLCLRDLKISVPEAVAAGDTVTLTCHYDLEKAALYSVRWYFELDEFYRYVPKESPPTRTFPMQGVSVDQTKSDENTVTLRSVSKIQSGMYQCEVSADAPLFHTESSQANMIVAELPQSEPVITVYGIQKMDNRNIIKLGETITASCQSSPSDPPVNFTWSVNDIKMQQRQSGLKEISTVENTWKNREAYSEFVVRIDNHMLQAAINTRKLVLRCETNIYSLYRGSDIVEFYVIDTNYWIHGGGKVSPTTDQRSGSGTNGAGGSGGNGATGTNPGDPDNSALKGSAILNKFNSKLYLLCYSFLICFLILINILT